ncbi:MAG: glycosyltransferase family 39 protein [Dehalococcoidales bacterium]|nr:glycosyltransferase family 39 protein [Dehalococcoidales bacterium]
MNKDYETGGSRFSPQLLVVILIAVFFGVALYLRVYLPYDQVFGSEWIKFTSVDAYRHMRLIDSLVHNFPHLIPFDPYLIYHEGISLAMGKIHFLQWFLAGIIWVIGLGSPAQHTVDVVSVYFPAILGALCVIPVYFIGKELFHRWAGVVAAGLIALLPGEFLGRSILGFTDHHVAEVLFSTTTILFLILAIKAARQRQVPLPTLNAGTGRHSRSRLFTVCLPASSSESTSSVGEGHCSLFLSSRFISSFSPLLTT